MTLPPLGEEAVMDERVRFVARLLKGEKMVALCRDLEYVVPDKAQLVAIVAFSHRR